MNKQQIRLFGNGIFNIIIGLILLYSGSWLFETLIEFIGIIDILFGILQLVQLPKFFIIKADKPLIFKFLDAIITIALGAFFVMKSFFPAFILAGVIAIYILLMGLLKLFNFILLKNDKVKGNWQILFSGLIYILIGLNIFSLNADAQELYQWTGAYLFISGINLLQGAYIFTKKNKLGKRFKRIGVPIIFTALISHDMLNKINNYLNHDTNQLKGNDLENIKDWLDTDGRENIIPDLEVWVHTSSKKGFDAVGHVDISYLGKTYSYGNYDEDSHKLFGTVGDGVLYEIDTKYYEQWIYEVDSRAVFRYGLVLSDEQKKIIKTQLQKIKANTRVFELTTDTQKTSYLGKLTSQFPTTKTYKFNKTKFKTYFVMTTNCVLLADTIIGKIGIDLINRSGMITPGAYQQYFDTEYVKPHSFVVNRSILKK